MAEHKFYQHFNAIIPNKVNTWDFQQYNSPKESLELFPFNYLCDTKRMDWTLMVKKKPDPSALHISPTLWL